MIGYGAKGDRIWGNANFEVRVCGAKGDTIWGKGDKIWGAVQNQLNLLKLSENITCITWKVRVCGAKGDKIWGASLERPYFMGKTGVQPPSGTLKVIGYGELSKPNADSVKKTCILEVMRTMVIKYHLNEIT